MKKFEDIKIPENIDDVTKAAIKRGKNYKRKKKTNSLIAASISILTVSSVGVGITNPKLVQAMPNVQELFINLNQKLNLGYSYDEETQKIKQSKEVNGVKVDIEEVIHDGYNVYITYTINSKEPLISSEELDNKKDKGMEFLSEIYVDFDGGLAGQYINDGYNGYYKDINTFVGLAKYAVVSDEVPDNFNMTMKILEIDDVDDDYSDHIKGPWEFKFNVKKYDKSERINVNKEIDEYKINYVDISPFYFKVNLTFPKSFIAKDQTEMKRVFIEDEKGEPLQRENYSQASLEDQVKNLDSYTIMNIDNDLVNVTYTIDMDRSNGYKKPEYIIIRFENYKNILKNGQVIEHIKDEENENIEFKVELNN